MTAMEQPMTKFSVRRVLVQRFRCRYGTIPNRYETLRKSPRFFGRKRLVGDTSTGSDRDAAEFVGEFDFDLDGRRDVGDGSTTATRRASAVTERHRGDMKQGMDDEEDEDDHVGDDDDGSLATSKGTDEDDGVGHSDGKVATTTNHSRRAHSCSGVSFYKDVENKVATSESSAATITTIFVGDDWIPYDVRKDWLRAEVFRVLIKDTESRGGRAFGKRTKKRMMHIDCDEVLFEHVLWLLSKNDALPGIDINFKALENSCNEDV